jgi:hypothetical protein
MILWIIPHRGITIPVQDIPRVGDEGVGGDETAKIRVVESGVIEVQPQAEVALAGVALVGGRAAAAVAHLSPGPDERLCRS